MGSARTTSVQLQVFAEEQSARRRDEQLPPRRTLWMWATMGALAGSLGPPQWMRTPERGTDALRAPVACACEDGPKDENDLTHDDFANRWRAPKQLELHVAPLETGASPRQRRPARRAKINQKPSTALSVFLCRITATDLVRLKARLQDIIEPKEDQVLFIRLCGACAVDIEALGVQTPAHDA
jgi:CRISPR-associated protein Cas2